MNDAEILQHISALRDALRYEINDLAAQVRLLRDSDVQRQNEVAELRADLATLQHKVDYP